jgi:hypothetical protein
MNVAARPERTHDFRLALTMSARLTRSFNAHRSQKSLNLERRMLHMAHIPLTSAVFLFGFALKVI